MTEHPQDLDQLIAGLERGESGAVEAMARRYYDRVQAIVRQHLRRDFRRRSRWMVAAFATGDVVNDVFVKILENPTVFGNLEERTDEAMVAYLARTVHHQLLDAVRYEERACRDVRRNTSRPEDFGTPGEPVANTETPSAHAAILEHLRVYKEVLETLEERQRRLIQLRVEEEMEFPDIARAVGFASDDVARRAFNRAKAILLVRMRGRGYGTAGAVNA